MVVPGTKKECCFTREIATHLTDPQAWISSRDCDTSKTMLYACVLMASQQKRNTEFTIQKDKYLGLNYDLLLSFTVVFWGRHLNIISWTRS